MRRRVAPRLRSERGYTLIELMWAIVLSLLVVGLPMAWIVSSLTQENVVASRAAAARQAEVGLEQLTRDLRQVAPNTTTTFSWSSSTATVTMTLPVPGTQGASTQSVTWSCAFGSTGTCTRQVGSGTQLALIRNVESLSFALQDATGATVPSGQTSPAPAFAGITLQVLDISQLDASTTPSHAISGVANYITLQDGVDLRANSL